MTMLYRYNMSDCILFTIGWFPTYLIDISRSFATNWFLEHVIISWLLYAARVMELGFKRKNILLKAKFLSILKSQKPAVSYFSLTPIAYFHHFRLYSKVNLMISSSINKCQSVSNPPIHSQSFATVLDSLGRAKEHRLENGSWQRFHQANYSRELSDVNRDFDYSQISESEQEGIPGEIEILQRKWKFCFLFLWYR